MGNTITGNDFIDIKSEIEKTKLEIDAIIQDKIVIKDEVSLESIEKKIIKATDRLAGLLIAQKIQESLDSFELKNESSELIKAHPQKMKNQGPREVCVRVSRGEPVKIVTDYYSMKGIKIGRKKRPGIYPGLFLLGIHDRCSPVLASDIAMMATILSSFEEAENVLKGRGADIDDKTIRIIVQRYADRARAFQREGESCFSETVAGCRVVISTDGGRIRIRKNKRGPKTKKGRNSFHTDWREPKLLIIYTVNEKGEMERTISPFIDGTLNGPNAILVLIKYYLAKLDISKADKILFIADGARWIWNLVPKVISSLKLSSDQFYELVDFYHAVEHLTKVVELQNGWKKLEIKRWVKKHRGLLLKGKAGEVINSIQQLVKGRNIKKLRRELNYFIRNRHRMHYDRISEDGLPIGSGAMESAIRRVVNLRLKSAGTYWLKETAEAMLLLRSYYKAGRWDNLKKMTFSKILVNIP